MFNMMRVIPEPKIDEEESNLNYSASEPLIKHGRKEYTKDVVPENIQLAPSLRRSKRLKNKIVAHLIHKYCLVTHVMPPSRVARPS